MTRSDQLEFNSRVAAQRRLLQLVNRQLGSAEQLAGITRDAIGRWSRANGVPNGDELIRLLIEASSRLQFLAAKSQEQVSTDYAATYSGFAEVVDAIKVVLARHSAEKQRLNHAPEIGLSQIVAAPKGYLNSEMEIVLQLPPETESQLKEQAAATGEAPEELALRILQAQLCKSARRPIRRSRRSRQKFTPEEWMADLRKWSESHDHGVVNADDSRESIYEGRGE